MKNPKIQNQRTLPEARYGGDGFYRIETEEDAYGALLKYVEVYCRDCDVAEKLLRRVKETTYYAFMRYRRPDGVWLWTERCLTYPTPVADPEWVADDFVNLLVKERPGGFAVEEVQIYYMKRQRPATATAKQEAQA